MLAARENGAWYRAELAMNLKELVVPIERRTGNDERYFGIRGVSHNALDDAVEQGELFANLLEWATRQRNAKAHGNGAESMPSWLAPHGAVIA